jgi:hypothetical protein
MPKTCLGADVFAEEHAVVRAGDAEDTAHVAGDFTVFRGPFAVKDANARGELFPNALEQAIVGRSDNRLARRRVGTIAGLAAGGGVGVIGAIRFL